MCSDTFIGGISVVCLSCLFLVSMYVQIVFSLVKAGEWLFLGGGAACLVDPMLSLYKVY